MTTQNTTAASLEAGAGSEQSGLAEQALVGLAGSEVSADEVVDVDLVEAMMSRVDESGLQLTGEGGFLPALIKAVLERGLSAELSEHLGYAKHDPAGRGSPNSRNGSTSKTLATEAGEIALDTPRDRQGSFESLTLGLAGTNPRFPWKPSTTMLTYRLKAPQSIRGRPRRTRPASADTPAERNGKWHRIFAHHGAPRRRRRIADLRKRR